MRSREQREKEEFESLEKQKARKVEAKVPSEKNISIASSHSSKRPLVSEKSVREKKPALLQIEEVDLPDSIEVSEKSFKDMEK